MSSLKSPKPVKFFFSLLFRSDLHTIESLEQKFKDYLIFEETFYPEFNPLTDYYEKEMGTPLTRAICLSHSLRERDELVSLKLWATDMENEFAQDSARTVNIDIGYIAKEHVVLATGKPYSHRVYVGKGVFSELVYIYRDKTFHKVPWTYPDYQHQEKIDFFNKSR